MSELVRIYVDWNKGPNGITPVTPLLPPNASINEADLNPGQRVIIHDEDLEVTATLALDSHGEMIAEYDPADFVAILAFYDAWENCIAEILELSDAGRPAGVSVDPADPEDPVYRAAFKRIQADPNNRLIVATLGGDIVGTMQITIIPGLTKRGLTRGLLENIHVRPGLRGQGIGSKMVAWAVDECREAGCGLVQLTSDKRRPDAHRFYGRLGFEPTHEGFKRVF